MSGREGKRRGVDEKGDLFDANDFNAILHIRERILGNENRLLLPLSRKVIRGILTS